MSVTLLRFRTGVFEIQNGPNFDTFAVPVEIRGGVGEMSDS